MPNRNPRQAMLSFRHKLRKLQAAMPDNKYIEWLAGAENPDLASRIIIQIPAYRDAELLKTIQSARLQAANPDRVFFAVCLQEMPENKNILAGVPNCRCEYLPLEQASGSCRARYICQGLYAPDEKDFVLYTDSHMRFAYGWDVYEIAQLATCENKKSMLTNYAENYTDHMSDSPDSSWFTEHVQPGRYVACSYFWQDTPVPIMYMGMRTGSETPVYGAFTGCGHVFAPAALDDIRFDPHMCFLGDEAAMAARWWTSGWDIMHPGLTCLYHLDKQAARKEQSAHRANMNKARPDGTTPRMAELARMEQLYGLKDHGIDLGRFTLGSERPLEAYHELAGIDLRNKTLRNYARTGPFLTDRSRYSEKQLAPFDWRTYHMSKNAWNRVSRHSAQKIYLDAGTGKKLTASKMPATDVINSALAAYLEHKIPDQNTRERFRYEIDRKLVQDPDQPYLTWLKAVRDPDLKSSILVEIPAYADPELLKTIQSARGMAANPERVYISVCAQAYDAATLDALDHVPNLKYRHFEPHEAPGLCAARACAQSMHDNQDYSLVIDSHMRFAYGWDVCLIHELSRCCDSRKPIITIHPQNYDEYYDRDPLDPVFTKRASLKTRILNADYFSDLTWKLRTRVNTSASEKHPVQGAFTAGGMRFMRMEPALEVPFDPDMYFVADEHSMSMRYWTHGCDIWHPYADPIWHLYYRTRVVKEKSGLDINRFPKTSDIAKHRQNEEPMRIEELTGLTGNYNRYGLKPGSRYGLGTERRLSDYEDYSGVYVSRLAIRKFAMSGRFDVEHDEAGMAFVDWFENRIKAGQPAPGAKAPLDAYVSDEQMLDLKALAASTGTPWEVLLQQAVKGFLA